MKCDSAHCPLLARLKLLESIILDGAPVPDPDMDEAVQASLRGDWGPLMRINERKGGDARQMATDNLGCETQEHRSLSSPS